tara:strand:+ start:312 stop:776 length:465 start_codon:yes stop_codon:yes gene_type:complete
MKHLQNKNIVLLDKNIMTVDILTQYPSGKFRHIVKTNLGMTCCDARSFDNPRICANPESAISGYKRGALQTVQFQPDGSDFWLTIFSRTGKKVKLIDESILANLTVGTINGMYDNTNLMCMHQYKAVNSTSWASKAFVGNGDTKPQHIAAYMGS